MQLKDVTPIIKAILEERDKIPRIIDKERYIPNPQPYHDGDCMCGGIRKALRIIEQAPVVDAMPRWISVEERLPEDEKDVAVIVKLQKGNWMYLTAFRLPCGGWWINRGAGLDYAEVTHWMPIPEPPKEESTC